ncbi:MAG: hypothetical protein J6A96_05135 [Clostridia bacterium]|nr:hypothetical protein [Clostridia bacterium]
MKKALSIVLLIILSFSMLLTACAPKNPVTSNTNKKLETPTNVRVVGTTLQWNVVDYASGYTVLINGTTYTCQINSYSLQDLPSGEYTLSVKANGDGVLYNSSAYSDSISYTRNANTGEEYKDEVVGAFGSFDEINTKNSYIGYGIDIINASAINSKNILATYPIFDMDKLMQEQLLKSNEHYNEFQCIEGKTIQEFYESMSNSTSMSSGKSASAKGQIKGVDVKGSASFSNGLKTGFTKTSSEVESQYFLRVISENLTYWLILQAGENRYKEILSEEFKSDLYNESISPAQLFSKYGTHLLTSVAMGGSICMDYTMYSKNKTTSQSNYVEVSGEFKTNVEASFGKYGASAGQENSFENTFSYEKTASKYEMQIEKKITCAGGGAYGINSEISLFENYFDWQNSLDTYPVVIGIKDSNSLYPIWDLLDLNVEGASERYQELYNYFQEYGKSSYNSLCESYNIYSGIDPEEIVNISVKDIANYKEGEIVKVVPGEEFQIEFDVLPENADNYKKTFSINSNNATVDNNGNVKVSENATNGSEFEIIITAGTSTKTVKFKVTKSYKVVFNTLVPEITVPEALVESSGLVKEPVVERDGYEIECWYKTYENGEYSNKFNFETDVVTGNLELFAKWVKIEEEGHTVKYVVSQDSTKTPAEFSDKTTEKNAIAYNNSSVVFEGAPRAKYYVFAGWYNSNGEMVIDASGVLQSNVAGFTTESGKWNLTNDVALYAKWENESAYEGYTYINSISELQTEITKNPSGKFLIVSNIDGNSASWTPIPEFYGVLDGDNNSIYGFSIEITGTGSATLGFIGKNSGTIQNLTIGNNDSKVYDNLYSVKYNIVYVEATSASDLLVGGIVGENSGIITDCNFVNATVYAEMSDKNNDNYAYLRVGGIVANNLETKTIKNCTVENSYIKIYMPVKSDSGDDNQGWLGGIVGKNLGNVENCKVFENTLDINVQGDGTITNDAYPYIAFGGIVGDQINGKLNGCEVESNTMKMHASQGGYTKPKLYGGTIIGVYRNGAVSDCYADVNQTITKSTTTKDPSAISVLVGDGTTTGCATKEFD